MHYIKPTETRGTYLSVEVDHQPCLPVSTPETEKIKSRSTSPKTENIKSKSPETENIKSETPETEKIKSKTPETENIKSKTPETENIKIKIS